MSAGVSPPDNKLPEHIEQSVQAIAAMHADHDRSASRVQRVAERVVRVASGPQFAVVLVVLIAAWIAGNLLQGRWGGQPFDAPPFQWLQDAIGTLALFLTVLILIAQRREYELDERRARLTLQLALLAEQKNAKIIEMLETLLTANPDVAAHPDPTALAMAKPVDSATILSAIDRKHREPDD